MCGVEGDEGGEGRAGRRRCARGGGGGGGARHGGGEVDGGERGEEALHPRPAQRPRAAPRGVRLPRRARQPEPAKPHRQPRLLERPQPPRVVGRAARARRLAQARRDGVVEGRRHAPHEVRRHHAQPEARARVGAVAQQQRARLRRHLQPAGVAHASQRRQPAHQLAEDDAQLLHHPLVVADGRADEDHASQPPDVLAPGVVRRALDARRDEVHLGVGGRRREHAALGHVGLQVTLRLGEAL